MRQQLFFIIFTIFIINIIVGDKSFVLGNDTLYAKVTQNLIRHTASLTGRTKSRNYKNLKQLNQAAEYIKKEFSKYSYKVKFQKFTVSNNEYKNVICVLNDNIDTTIIIGAHYDVYGNFTGADDNAGAVAGLIEIGRLLSKNNKNKYRIELAAYTLEEPPFFGTNLMGSYIHAKQCKTDNVNIKLMICLEMIGYYSDKKNTQTYPAGFMKWFYGTTGDYIAVVSKSGQGKYSRAICDLINKHSNIEAKRLNAPKFLTGIDFSDHRNYWKFGYPAIMVTDTAFYRNPHYHKKTDTIQTLNFLKMTELVKGIYNAVISY